MTALLICSATTALDAFGNAVVEGAISVQCHLPDGHGGAHWHLLTNSLGLAPRPIAWAMEVDL